MEIKTEDLVRMCARCGGSGKEAPLVLGPGAAQEQRRCQACGGCGKEPTPSGIALRNLLDVLKARREL